MSLRSGNRGFKKGLKFEQEGEKVPAEENRLVRSLRKAGTQQDVKRITLWVQGVGRAR